MNKAFYKHLLEIYNKPKKFVREQADTPFGKSWLGGGSEGIFNFAPGLNRYNDPQYKGEKADNFLDAIGNSILNLGSHLGNFLGADNTSTGGREFRKGATNRPGIFKTYFGLDENDMEEQRTQKKPRPGTLIQPGGSNTYTEQHYKRTKGMNKPAGDKKGGSSHGSHGFGSMKNEATPYLPTKPTNSTVENPLSKKPQGFGTMQGKPNTKGGFLNPQGFGTMQGKPNTKLGENAISALIESGYTYKDITLFENFLNNPRQVLMEQGGSPIDGFKQMWNTLTDKDAWSDVGEGFKQYGQAWGDLFSDAWGGIKDVGSSIWDAISGGGGEDTPPTPPTTESVRRSSRRGRLSERQIRVLREHGYTRKNIKMFENFLNNPRPLMEQGGNPLDGFKQMFNTLTDKDAWSDVGKGFKQFGGAIGNMFKDATDFLTPGINLWGDNAAASVGKNVGKTGNIVTKQGNVTNEQSDEVDYLKQMHDTSKALTKNENMKPHENANALRDWTTNMKEALMQERDYDGDGKVESGQEEWKGSRDKAIKNNMNELNPAFDQYYMNPKALVRDKESGANKRVYQTGNTLGTYVKNESGDLNEKEVFYTDDKDRVRKFDDGR